MRFAPRTHGTRCVHGPCPPPDAHFAHSTKLLPFRPSFKQLSTPPLDPSSDSAGRYLLQPAAELRHGQRQRHVPNVWGASMIERHSKMSGSLPHTLLIPSTTSRLLLTLQGAMSFDQPLKLDTSSVTDMTDIFAARSAHTRLAAFPAHHRTFTRFKCAVCSSASAGCRLVVRYQQAADQLRLDGKPRVRPVR